jgi:hypothetical protein
MPARVSEPEARTLCHRMLSPNLGLRSYSPGGGVSASGTIGGSDAGHECFAITPHNNCPSLPDSRQKRGERLPPALVLIREPGAKAMRCDHGYASFAAALA